jgi:hypothetical protein
MIQVIREEQTEHTDFSFNFYPGREISNFGRKICYIDF